MTLTKDHIVIKLSAFLILGFSCFFLMFSTTETAVAAPEIPEQSVLAEIIEETMLEFAIAVKAEDFTVFYRRISKFWQDQVTKEELLNEFQSFIDKKIDLTALEGKKPDIDKKPILDKKGWLILQGKYEAFPILVEFNLEYVHEDMVWKLVGINVKTSPMPGSEPESGKMPTAAFMKQIVQKVMLDFAEAVNARDFSDFYAEISEIWQKQITKEKMEATFKSFSDKKIDLSVLKGHLPEFTVAPFINNKNVLIIKGKYLVSEGEVLFEHKYIYEASAWKLLGIKVNIGPNTLAKTKSEIIPPQVEIRSLVQQTMQDFALALKAKDFSKFYKNIAQIWQDQTSLDEFSRIFKSFIDKNIDLTGIKGLEPVLEKPSYLDNNGLLCVQGAYATKPSKSMFNLKYLLENGAWKLAGIKINMK